MHERRAFDLSRPRALRAPGSEYFLHQSLASTASFSESRYWSFWSSSPERTRERGRREEIQKNNERKTSLERESVFKKHQHDLWYKVRRNISRPKRRASPQKALLFPSSSDACFASTWSSPRTLYISFFLFQRVLVSFNYVFFFFFLLVVCSSFLFFRVFFTRKRTKNQIKRYLETSARANQKAHEGGLFPLDGLKKCFIQAHCFRRKSRSQTTNKKLFCSRERERGFEGEDDALGWIPPSSSESQREREIHSCHRRNSNPPVPNRRQRTSLPLFSKKKAIGLRARRRRKRDANEGFEKRTQNWVKRIFTSESKYLLKRFSVR